MNIGSLILGKRLIIPIGVILLIALITTPLFVSQFSSSDANNGKKSSQTTPTTQDLKAQRVFIKDFYSYNDTIDSETRRIIERRLYTNIVGDTSLGHSHEAEQDGDSLNISSNEGMHNLYTGVVRKNSLSKSSIKNTHTTKLLIDVEPINMTYEIKVIKQDIDGHESRSLYISCAPKSLAMDSSIQCKGGDV